MGKKKWTRPRSKASGPGATLKRGSLRLKATKTEARSGRQHASYVPQGQRGKQEARRGREQLSVTGSTLKHLPVTQLKMHLVSLGHLPDLKARSACLYCGHKSLSVKGCPPLSAVLKGWGARYFRCTRKCCHKQQHFLSNSPVFYIGRGADVPPLRQQSRRPVALGLANAHPGFDDMRSRWRAVLTKFVEEKQSRAQGGDFHEVEVDEAVVRKQKVGGKV